MAKAVGSDNYRIFDYFDYTCIFEVNLMPLDLSIIIPTHNSASTIDSCINSITSQSHPRERYEIIVVDDGSNDKTVEMAKNAGADKIVETEPCFQGKARNIGVKNANADLLGFLDSDCKAKSDWVESIVNELNKVRAVTGPIHNENSHSSVAWAEYFLEFGQFHKFRRKSQVRWLPGCNQGYTREAFQKTGGFSETPTSEDVLFGESLKKAGIEAFFIPQIQISHLCRTEIDKMKNNMKMLGKYSVRTSKLAPTAKYSTLMSHQVLVPILFFGKIIKAANYSTKSKNFRRFIGAFPMVVLGSLAFCKGVWNELEVSRFLESKFV